MTTTGLPAARTIFERHIERSIAYIARTYRPAEIDSLSNDESGTILTALNYGLGNERWWDQVCPLILDLAPVMERLNIGDGWLHVMETALLEGRRHRAETACAELEYRIGVLHQSRAAYRRAIDHFSASAAHSLNSGDPLLQARALDHRAYCQRLRRDYPAARASLQAAKALLPEDAPELSYNIMVEGLIALDGGENELAIQLLRESLSSAPLQDKKAVGWCWNNLGMALRQVNQYEEAIDAYQTAIQICDEIHDLHNKAIAEMNLGNVYILIEQPAKAVEIYRKAEMVFHSLANPRRMATLTLNIGIAYRRMREWSEAKRCLHDSIERWRQIEDHIAEIDAMDELGMVYLDKGVPAKAVPWFDRALVRLKSVKDDPEHGSLYGTVTEHMQIAKRMA